MGRRLLAIGWTVLLAGCAESDVSATGDARHDTIDAREDVVGTLGETRDASSGVGYLEIEPSNDTCSIDRLTGTHCVIVFQLFLVRPEASSVDVTGSADVKWQVDDPVGTSVGSTFTAVSTLPGGASSIVTLVRASHAGDSASTALTVEYKK